jgi:hypothetical protein
MRDSIAMANPFLYWEDIKSSQEFAYDLSVENSIVKSRSASLSVETLVKSGLFFGLSLLTFSSFAMST